MRGSACKSQSAQIHATDPDLGRMECGKTMNVRCYGSRNQGSKGAVNDNMSGSGSMAKGKRLEPRRNSATRLSDQDSDQGWGLEGERIRGTRCGGGIWARGNKQGHSAHILGREEIGGAEKAKRRWVGQFQSEGNQTNRWELEPHSPDCYLWIKFHRAPFMSLVEYDRGISSSTDGSGKKMHGMNGTIPR
ncbi:hypothetical protein PCH_Pc22g12500 [Penicillium rubens Wisconsin 54-1255]|uniref:Uncharacterized protein n=1 Tax=Penicillium rubens (strain ATCC 28089 / DSM 1075 / NRRL 1951 / Wisconsin 54-1255) TaxID=500485 RepID=B6HRW8_PENRW|nr:hypothetical protein PCH_Pc22g12500 [Penicillium rubens Wisconsin 54-1255]